MNGLAKSGGLGVPTRGRTQALRIAYGNGYAHKDDIVVVSVYAIGLSRNCLGGLGLLRHRHELADEGPDSIPTANASNGYKLLRMLDVSGPTVVGQVTDLFGHWPLAFLLESGLIEIDETEGVVHVTSFGRRTARAGERYL